MYFLICTDLLWTRSWEIDTLHWKKKPNGNSRSVFEENCTTIQFFHTNYCLSETITEIVSQSNGHSHTTEQSKAPTAAQSSLLKQNNKQQHFSSVLTVAWHSSYEKCVFGFHFCVPLLYFPFVPNLILSRWWIFRVSFLSSSLQRINWYLFIEWTEVVNVMTLVCHFWWTEKNPRMRVDYHRYDYY